MLKKEGPRALYRGYGPTLWSFGAFSGLYWAFYEQLRPSDTSVSFADALPCALGAGAAASWLTAPLDLAKLRVQVHRGADGPSFLRALVDASKAGPRGLFRGAGARVLFSAPSMGASRFAPWQEQRQAASLCASHASGQSIFDG